MITTALSCSPGVIGPHRWQCDPPRWNGECGIVHAVCSVCGDERDWPAIGELRRDIMPQLFKATAKTETMPDFAVLERHHNPLRTPVSAVTPYRTGYSMPPDAPQGPLVGENRAVDVVPSGTPLPAPQTGLKQRKTKGEKRMAKSRHDTYEKHRLYELRKPDIIRTFRATGSIYKAAADMEISKSTLRGLLVRWGEYVPGKEREPETLVSTSRPLYEGTYTTAPAREPLTIDALKEAILATPPPSAYLAALLERLKAAENACFAVVEQNQGKARQLGDDIAAVERVMALVGGSDGI